MKATLSLGAVILAASFSVGLGQSGGAPGKQPTDSKGVTSEVSRDPGKVGSDTAGDTKGGQRAVESAQAQKKLSPAELRGRLSSSELDASIADDAKNEAGDRLKQMLENFAEKYRKLDTRNIQETNFAAESLLQLLDAFDTEASLIIKEAPTLRQNLKKYQKAILEAAPSIRDIADTYLALAATPDDEFAPSYRRLAESAKRLAAERKKEGENVGTIEQNVEQMLKKVESARVFVSNVRPLVKLSLRENDGAQEVARLKEFENTLQLLVKTVEEFAKGLATPTPPPPTTPTPAQGKPQA